MAVSIKIHYYPCHNLYLSLVNLRPVRIIGRKARGKETTRKTDAGGYGPFRGGIECCGLDWSGSG
jgi:hypothetical protein